MGLAKSRLAVTAAAVAAPAWAVLAALVLFGALTPGPAALAALAASILAGLIAWPHLRSLAALAAAAEDLGLEERTAPPPRSLLAAEISVGFARARRRIAAAQQEIEARAAGAEAILDSIPEPLLVLDRGRQVVHANLAAETLLGADLAGRDLATVLRNPEILTAVRESLGDGHGRAVDFELKLPVDRFLRARIATLPEWSGGGDALILTLEDQTSIRRSERMRVDFVANVSHELRTPLATLLGFIETLLGPARDDAEARERFLGIMQDQATRMGRIVEDLLSLSRIELDEHIPPAGSVEIPALLRGVVDSLELVASQREMRIVLDCPESLPLVTGDEGQVAQVFSNLLENALKYARAGTPVEITAKVVPEVGGAPVEAGGRFVVITIGDQGEGIPREHLARLTERFYRVDTARSRNVGGTGLGLAIVKHIVNRHRGALAIDSVLGEGSRFTVTLPIKPGAAIPARQSGAETRPGGRH